MSFDPSSVERPPIRVNVLYWAVTVGFLVSFSCWIALGLYLISAWWVAGIGWIVLGLWAVGYTFLELVIRRPR